MTISSVEATEVFQYLVDNGHILSIGRKSLEEFLSKAKRDNAVALRERSGDVR